MKNEYNNCSGSFLPHRMVERKIAFTLAETLITLGIIGVVAALTIPVLVEKHQKRVVVSRLQKFYTNINQAIRLSETENGSCNDWDTPSSSNSYEMEDFYNSYLNKYLKTVSKSIKELDMFDANGDVEYSATFYILYFSDGSAMAIRKPSNNSSLPQLDINFYPHASKINKTVTSTREIFVFNFDNTKACLVEPYTTSWDGTRKMLISDSRYGCSKRGDYCAKLIQIDGWQIKDDYPW